MTSLNSKFKNQFLNSSPTRVFSIVIVTVELELNEVKLSDGRLLYYPPQQAELRRGLNLLSFGKRREAR